MRKQQLLKIFACVGHMPPKIICLPTGLICPAQYVSTEVTHIFYPQLRFYSQFGVPPVVRDPQLTGLALYQHKILSCHKFFAYVTYLPEIYYFH